MIHLSRLDLLRWGSFTDRRLTLGAPDERLHLVYGGNAAGKSTARRGTRALLFGIPARTQDGHTHDYQDLRIGAELLTDAGSVEVIRRKGNVNTLLGPDGLPLDEDPIAIAMRGLTGEVYAGLFEISHESLVEGGRDLLAGHGAVGESLFAAAAGTGRLHRLLTALDREAADLFKPSGRTAPLNVVVSDYAAAMKQMNSETVRPTAAVEMRRAVDAAHRRIADLDGEIRDYEERRGRLRRLKAVKPMLARHASLSDELEATDSPRDLDPDAPERRLDAQHDRDEAQRDMTAAEERLASLREELDRCEDPGRLIEVEAGIRAVHSEVAAIRKGGIDRRKREGELQSEQTRLGDLLAAIGPDVTPETIETYMGQGRTRRALDRHLDQRGEIGERLRNARERADAATRALESAKAELERTPTAINTSPLRAALRAGAKVGPIEAHAAEARVRSADAAADADRRFAQLNPRPAQVDDLDQLPIPAADLIARFETSEDELNADIAAETRERDRLDKEVAVVDARRAELETIGEAPTAEQLAEVRHTRDERWSLVREATQVRVGDAEARTVRFEESMTAADRIADARVDHADVLAQAAEIDAAVAQLATEREAVDVRLAGLRQRRERLQVEWDSAWVGEMAAPEISTAQNWLSQRERICDLRREAERAGREADEADERAKRHAVALTSRMTALGAAIPEDATLEELIALSESVAEDLEAQSEAHRTAVDAVDRAVRTRDEEERIVLEAQQTSATWSDEWVRLRDEYGLAADVVAEEAASVLRAIDNAVAAHSHIAELSRRIDGIDRDHDNFSKEVEEICTAVCPDLAGADPERVAVVLMERLTDALRAREAMDRLDTEIQRAEATITDAQRRFEDAQKRLDALMRKAQVKREDELPEVERYSSRAAELRQEIPACEREVAEAGDEPFDALRDAASQLTTDQLDAEIAELDRKLGALREERDASQQIAFQARDTLDHAESSESASAVAELVQQQLASARDLAHRYAVAKLSASLMRDTIERYRSKHQGPMLERANALFPMLTCDTFSELYVDWDDAGEPVLVGRDSENRPLRVEQMSDGTREQLFLALRIAAIERYVESSGPVPVLFDDVFLESDDPRAERIFKALADLARRTQVIVLTHHRHLVAIAQRVLDPERVALHDLDGTLGELRAQGRSSKRRATAA